MWLLWTKMGLQLNPGKQIHTFDFLSFSSGLERMTDVMLIRCVYLFLALRSSKATIIMHILFCLFSIKVKYKNITQRSTSVDKQTVPLCQFLLLSLVVVLSSILMDETKQKQTEWTTCRPLCPSRNDNTIMTIYRLNQGQFLWKRDIIHDYTDYRVWSTVCSRHITGLK